MSTPIRAPNSFYTRSKTPSPAGGNGGSVGLRRRNNSCMVPMLTPTPQARGRYTGNEAPKRNFDVYAPGMLLKEQEISFSGGSDMEDSVDFQSPDPLSQSVSETSDVFSGRTMSLPSTRMLPQSQDYSRVISLLQQQQVVLQQVLNGQLSLEKRQDHVESEILRLGSDFDVFRDSSQSFSADSRSDKKRKRLVSHALSVSYYIAEKYTP